jgi:hypothetical protein
LRDSPTPLKPVEEPVGWDGAEERIAAAQREATERKRVQFAREPPAFSTEAAEHIEEAVGLIAAQEQYERELRRFGAWLPAEREHDTDEEGKISRPRRRARASRATAKS